MKRGVYRAELGGITELTAVGDDGQFVKRITVRTELLRDADSRGHPRGA